MPGAFLRIWRPRPGQFGGNYVTAMQEIGAGGISVGNSTTTSYILPVPATTNNSNGNAHAFLVGLSFQQHVLMVLASGSATLQVFRRNNAGAGADVALTGLFNPLASSTVDKSFLVPITGLDASCTFSPADACRVDVVTSGTVNTQPTACIVATFGIQHG